MKISRMAEENLAPSWAFEDSEKLASSEFIDKYVSQDDIERMQALPDGDLTEDQIIEQREVIEACADKNEAYRYSSKLSDKSKSALKEYAIVCGLPESKFQSVDIDAVHSIVAESTETIKREASVKNDPFNLDTKGDMSHMETSKWEDIHKQANLGLKPDINGGIVPVRGGEDYYANSDPKTARGQNSITDPFAIEEFANSEIEDNGERLRRENEMKAELQKKRHEQWEREKVAAMEGSEIIPKGSVFATEVMNAQPGLDSDKIHMGVYSDFDLKDMPDKTDGERLAEINEARRQKIQGAPKESRDFTPEQIPVRGISDSFAEELKKHIK